MNLIWLQAEIHMLEHRIAAMKTAQETVQQNGEDWTRFVRAESHIKQAVEILKGEA